jgi:hypothetical protein
MKLKESESAEIEKLKVSAEKAQAEESVETSKAIEEAERQAKIKVVEAEGKAEEEYVAKQKLAEAEAYQIMKTAEAELEASKLKAESIQLLAKAELEEMKAKAEGEKMMIESKNIAEEKILIQEPVMALVENLPEIAERLMKPAEKIESIRVLDMGGQGNSPVGASSTTSKITNAILGAGAAMPIMKEFLNFSGMDAEKLMQKAADYLPFGKAAKAEEPVIAKESVEVDEPKASVEESADVPSALSEIVEAEEPVTQEESVEPDEEEVPIEEPVSKEKASVEEPVSEEEAPAEESDSEQA